MPKIELIYLYKIEQQFYKRCVVVDGSSQANTAFALKPFINLWNAHAILMFDKILMYYNTSPHNNTRHH